MQLRLDAFVVSYVPLPTLASMIAAFLLALTGIRAFLAAGFDTGKLGLTSSVGWGAQFGAAIGTALGVGAFIETSRIVRQLLEKRYNKQAVQDVRQALSFL